MKIAYFTHSLQSCWNHGNAHFVRGVLSELIGRGHEVRALEPAGAWSLENLLKDHGQEGLGAFRASYPELSPIVYAPDADVAELVGDAELVIVHEWNAPELVAAVGRLRAQGGRFTLLFHDTHHRAVSAPEQMRAYDLESYDGVLAFGATLANVYDKWGWGGRVFVWHEAADTRRFRPPAEEGERQGLVWIGNWGEDERTQELIDYLLRPAQ
jgi:spore maturation protein CgeB